MLVFMHSLVYLFACCCVILSGHTKLLGTALFDPRGRPFAPSELSLRLGLVAVTVLSAALLGFCWLIGCALFARFACALRVVLEVAAASLAAHACYFSLLAFVHAGETSIVVCHTHLLY